MLPEDLRCFEQFRQFAVGCGGFVDELPAMVAVLPAAGAFDEGLNLGSAGLRALAARRGWAAGRPYEPAGPPD